MRTNALVTLVVCLAANGLFGCATVSPKAKSAKRSESALNNLQLPDVRITSVTREKTDRKDGSGDIAYFDVNGVIGGTIEFELLLPEGWNRRFVMGGGGGFVGSVQNSMRDSVKSGYATAGTDTGHKGTGFDGSFALNDALAQVNFAHVAVHRTAEVAKAIIREHYGAGPQYSYFLGGSRGGGQAMMESQRYPDDFNGIVAAAPAFDWTGFSENFLRITQIFYPNPNTLDKTILTKEELAKFSDEVLLRYDEQDGLKDGIISDPQSIEISLESFTWLSAPQREAITAIYGGIRNQDGQIYPGYPVGSEKESGGWFTWLVGPASGFPFPTAGFSFGVDTFKFFVFNDPSWDYSKYDFSTYAEDTRLAASTLNAVDTDLSKFGARGGKLIIWHGWADPALTAIATVDYYKKLLERDPTAKDYTRLYLIPGCGHGGGGPGISKVDWLNVISDWVEQGKAPDTIIASKPAKIDGRPITRPLAPYPMRTVYKGSGDPNHADSFQTVGP